MTVATGRPATGQPTTGHPTTGQPTTGQPTTGQPATGHGTAGGTGPAAAPAGQSRPEEPPRLADGVELLGEYQDSGYRQPPSLVRRPDGQVIQMSPLLYRVTSRINGSREPAVIARLVSDDV